MKLSRPLRIAWTVFSSTHDNIKTTHESIVPEILVLPLNLKLKIECKSGFSLSHTYRTLLPTPNVEKKAICVFASGQALKETPANLFSLKR